MVNTKLGKSKHVPLINVFEFAELDETSPIDYIGIKNLRAMVSPKVDEILDSELEYVAKGSKKSSIVLESLLGQMMTRAMIRGENFEPISFYSKVYSAVFPRIYNPYKKLLKAIENTK